MSWCVSWSCSSDGFQWLFKAEPRGLRNKQGLKSWGLTNLMHINFPTEREVTLPAGELWRRHAWSHFHSLHWRSHSTSQAQSFLEVWSLSSQRNCSHHSISTGKKRSQMKKEHLIWRCQLHEQCTVKWYNLCQQMVQRKPRWCQQQQPTGCTVLCEGVVQLSKQWGGAGGFTLNSHPPAVYPRWLWTHRCRCCSWKSFQWGCPGRSLRAEGETQHGSWR